MQLQLIDWLVIGSYVAFALIVGIRLSRRASSSPDEFFLSGRSLPWWITGTSMVATTFAADTPLVVTGWVRDFGIWKNWLWWCFAVGGMLTVFIFARYWHRGQVMTTAELSELRYGGKGAKVLRGFLGFYHASLTNTIILCWVLLAAAKIMGVVFGVEKVPALVIASALALGYSLLAGFWGVVLTDLVQFAMAMTGAICFAVISWNAVGGLPEIESTVAGLGESGRDLLRFVPAAGEGSPFEGSFWTVPIAALAVYLGVSWWGTAGVDGGPVVVQRLAATRSPREGMFAALWYNIANYALRPWPWVVVALASLVVLPHVQVESPVTGTITAYEPGEEIPKSIQVRHEDGTVREHNVAELIGTTAQNTAIEIRLASDQEQTGSDQLVPKIVTLDRQPQKYGSVTIATPDGQETSVPFNALEAWGDDAGKIPNNLLGKELAAGELIHRTDSERAYVVMMVRYLPVGLLGLVVASLLAAFMSTIDTHVNLAASFYVNDVHRRFIAPGGSDRHYVVVARLASIAVLSLGAILAKASNSISDLFTFFLAFLGGVGPIYVLRWLWWRITAIAEITAMVASSLSATFLSSPGLQKLFFGQPINWPVSALAPEGALSPEGRLILVVLFAGGCALISLAVRPAPDPRKLVPFYEKIRPIGAWGPVRALTDVSPPRRDAIAAVVGVAAGLALTYSLMFGIGFVILDHSKEAGVSAGIAALALCGVIYACRQLGERSKPDPR